MKVSVYLIVFTSDIENAPNSFVLLRDGDILTEEMLDNSTSSFSMIEEMMKRSMNITGRWAEATPRLVGILDDETRIDLVTKTKHIAIVYALYLSNRNNVNRGYVWTPIKDIETKCNNDTSKNIIRYAATSM